MKIAQVCHRFYPNTGGIEKHVYEISKRLARKFEVDIISADKNGLLEFEVIDNIRVFRFKSFHPSNAYYFSPNIYLFLKNNNYDVVHIHNYHAFPAFFASFACDNFVFTPHYHGKGSSLLRNILNQPYKLIAKKIFEKAGVVICVSEYEKNLVSKNFNIKKDKIYVIPNGIDFEMIKRARKFDCEDFVLYVGRLEKYKNLDILIKSMKYLTNYKLYIVGEGNYKYYLEKLVNNLNLNKKVIFLGKISEEKKFSLMKSCSVFVNLSDIEAFGITVLEALACGAPVVVNNRGALSEFAKKFKFVYAISNVSPKELAKSIQNISNIPIKINLSSYDWNYIVKKLEKVYNII